MFCFWFIIIIAKRSSEQQIFPSVSLRACSLSVLFARVSWRRQSASEASRRVEWGNEFRLPPYSYPVAIIILGEKESRSDSIEARRVTWEGAKEK